MWIPSKKEISSVIVLDAPERYSYFLKKVADTQKIWGLYNDGWALASDDNGNNLLPLWPSKEYASLLKNDLWKEYDPTEIDVHDFVNEYAEEVEKNGIFFAVFYKDNDYGVVVKGLDLKSDINNELSRLE